MRVAEFDSLLTTALLSASRPEPGLLRLHLDADAEAIVRDLIARESRCCAFFDFRLDVTADDLRLDVRVPAAHVEVLDAILRRA